MSTSEHIPLAEVKDHLSEVVERVNREHGRVVITKHGRPTAVVISVEDLDALEETLDVLADSPLSRDIREALAELENAPASALSKDEALRLVAGA